MSSTTLSAQQQLATLFRVNQFLSRIGDLQQLLRLVMQEAERTVNAQASSIALVDERSGRLTFYVATGAKGRVLRAVTLAKGQGILGTVALRGRAINCPDVRSDPRFESSIDKRTRFQTRSVLAIPVRHQGRLIGVLEVLNKRGASGRFTMKDQALLQVVAGQAAVAIENAKLVQRLTEQHRALQQALRQLRASQRRLVQTERLSAVGAMASSLIHDLKNPLTSVRSFCQMLGMGQLGPDDVREFTTEAIRAVDEFVALARDILEYARGEIQLERQPTELTECVGSTVTMLKPLLDQQHIVVAQTVTVQRPVSIDPVRFRRVLSNLIGNAKDAMGNGGTLTILGREVEGAVEVAVTDTGVGIPRAIRRTLFEPFVTYGKPHGTGLGMAIVKSVVEAHGGTVSVESCTADEGEHGVHGTTVTVWLPVTSDAPDQL